MLTGLRVSAVQYAVNGGSSISWLLERIEGFVEQAVRARSDIVVFPELFALDMLPAKPSDITAAEEARLLRGIAAELNRGYFEFIGKLSGSLGVSILAGSVPRLEGDQIFNTACLAIPGSGGGLHFQDKVFLTYVERNLWNWSPGRELRRISAPWGRTVIPICYDVEVPGLSSELARFQPEVFLVPSCTEAIYGFERVKRTSQARAVEHFAYVVNVGTVGGGTGTPGMSAQYGQANAYTPVEPGFAMTLPGGPLNHEAIVHFDLDLDQLRKTRLNVRAFPARDQMLLKGEKL